MNCFLTSLCEGHRFPPLTQYVVFWGSQESWAWLSPHSRPKKRSPARLCQQDCVELPAIDSDPDRATGGV